METYAIVGVIGVVLAAANVPWSKLKLPKFGNKTTQNNCKAVSFARVTVQGKSFDLSMSEASDLAEDLETILDGPARRT